MLVYMYMQHYLLKNRFSNDCLANQPLMGCGPKIYSSHLKSIFCPATTVTNRCQRVKTLTNVTLVKSMGNMLHTFNPFAYIHISLVLGSNFEKCIEKLYKK